MADHHVLDTDGCVTDCRRCHHLCFLRPWLSFNWFGVGGDIRSAVAARFGDGLRQQLAINVQVHLELNISCQPIVRKLLGRRTQPAIFRSY
jgi:hypothetical protein